MQGGRGAHVHMVEAVVAVHDHAAARSFRLQHHRAAAAHVHQLVEVQVQVRTHIEDLRVVAQGETGIADRVIGSVHHGLLAVHLLLEGAVVVDGGAADLHLLLEGGRCAGTALVYFDVVHLRPRVGCREGGLGTERQAGDQCHGKDQVFLHVIEGFQVSDIAYLFLGGSIAYYKNLSIILFYGIVKSV